jgi:hypothetical protein
MQRYGMNVNRSDSKEKIDMAFLSLLPRSRAFRKDFAKLATPVAEKIHSTYKNYVGEDFFNLFGVEKKNPVDDIMKIPSKGIGSTSVTTAVTPTKTKKSFGDTGFGSWLTDVFDKDTTQNIINTGLGVYAYQKTAGTQGQPNPLNQGRADVQNQPLPSGQNQPSGSTGLGTGGIVAISLGALALVGFGIYYATKK